MSRELISSGASFEERSATPGLGLTVTVRIVAAHTNLRCLPARE